MPKRISSSAADTIEKKIIDYAEDLGRLLGSVRARVDEWKGERDKLVQQLSIIVQDAQSLLVDLGHDAGREVRHLKTVARDVAADIPGKVQQVRRVSAQARAKMAEAQRRRWAEYRKKHAK
jgi:hypothetical protein